jgi:hypothetical protein
MEISMKRRFMVLTTFARAIESIFDVIYKHDNVSILQYSAADPAWNSPKKQVAHLVNTGNGYEFHTDGRIVELDFSEAQHLLILLKTDNFTFEKDSRQDYKIVEVK